MKKHYHKNTKNITTCCTNNKLECIESKTSNVMPFLRKYKSKKKNSFLLNKIFILSALMLTNPLFSKDFLEKCDNTIKYNNGNNMHGSMTNRSLYEDTPYNTFKDDITKDDIINENVLSDELIDTNLINNGLLNENLKRNLTDTSIEDANSEKEKIKSILYSYMDKIDSMNENKLYYKLFRKCREEENDENPMRFF
ncbi:hypothetical protein, conserved [Plasmodium gonderi]|uniref:Uncharacterized protein n=1 Tax=Plasmodium gonderi TaxID=77519 RepID=A0A1Y1JHP7_PLAGO|nr:hypothetical protein, conserved [Plasmodium gonderi]GAW79604.1 hypothetical protein, conserved [Plasmodium gonderi]